MSYDDLIAGYFAYSDQLQLGVPPDTPEVDALEAAYDRVENVVGSAPIEEAWQLTREVLRRAPDSELDRYAVALLELFVSLRREAAVEPIEREAAADERFRWALGRIWLDSDLPEDASRRLRRASGDVITIPDRRTQ